MDVFALTMRLKEEGAAAVKAATDRLGKAFDGTTAKAKAYDLTLGSLKGALGGLAGGLALASVFQKIITETSDAEYAAAQLNAALKSTKGVAGQSADALNAHAQALSYVSQFDDDAITGAQALLLTFTKIQGDVFPKATAAILDMAAAMGTDLKSATIQVGKALNDPILGVSALGRAGVQFSESQKEVIASLAETGRMAEAQGIILAELKTQFEGSAEAASKTLGGSLKRLSNELGNLFTLSSNGSSSFAKFINDTTDAIIGLRAAVLSLGDIPGASLLGALARFGLGGFIEIYEGLAKTGRDIKAAAKIAADAVASTAPPKFLLDSAFEGLQQRQLEIKQLIQLSSVKKLDASQTKILRDELRKLTAEMDRQGLSLQGQYEIGKRIVDLQKALPAVTAKTALAAIPKLRSAIGGMVNTQTVPRIPPAMVTAVDPATVAKVHAGVVELGLETERRANEVTDKLRVSLGEGMVNVFGDSLSAGFEAAVASGNIGDGFKALTSTLLSGLGGMLIEFGKYAVASAKLMASLYKSIPTNPLAAVGVGLAMIALGATLRGVAGKVFSGGSAPPTQSIAGFGGGGSSGGGMTMPTAFFGPTAAGSANTIERINPVNVTIIGPNDPTAQRQMQELLRNADRRGNV